jgi:hypothetical protein
MADVGPTPECPCGAKVSDEQKNAVNWGRSNPVFQNPVASQINNAQGGFAAGLAKVDTILAVLPGDKSQINKLKNTIGNMQGILTNYSNTSNRLSGIGFNPSAPGGEGPDLLSLVSTVGAAINFQCALGIDGLDVGVGIGLMTENGKLKLNVAINAQADLNKILDNILAGGGTGADILNGVKSAVAEIAKITNAINAIAGEINDSINAVNGLFTDALNFISQFTNINFAINFSNDPCTKFGVGFQQGILNPAFIEQARAANPLNQAANPGFGSTTR